MNDLENTIQKAIGYITLTLILICLVSFMIGYCEGTREAKNQVLESVK